MKRHTVLNQLPESPSGANHGLELRHLRYLVAVADAGTFTQAAERIFIAQPTLSQQIRRLEEMVGTPLLQRRRDGVRLTAAGQVLLEESRAVLSLLDHGVSRSRHAAGLGRPALRVVLPPCLPEGLAVEIASRLRSVAATAGTDISWMETALDAEFSLVGQRRADAGLGWLSRAEGTLPYPLEIMSLGTFLPEVWIPASEEGDRRLTISFDELARMRVIHGPRRTHAATYDAWLTVLRTSQPRFEFTDPPFRHSLPITLAFAATSDRPVAVLTGPLHHTEAQTTPIWPRPAEEFNMVRVGIEGRPLTAMAVLVWSRDLPDELQQVLFDTADRITICESSAAAS